MTTGIIHTANITHLHGLLLSIATRATKLPIHVMNDSIKIFNHLTENNTDIPESTYTSLIKVCALAGNPYEGVNQLDRMCRAGLVPRLRTYSGLIASLTELQDISALVPLFYHMRENKVEPSQDEYAQILKLLRLGYHEQPGLDLLNGLIDIPVTYVLQRSLQEAVTMFFSSDDNIDKNFMKVLNPQIYDKSVANDVVQAILSTVNHRYANVDARGATLLSLRDQNNLATSTPQELRTKAESLLQLSSLSSSSTSSSSSSTTAIPLRSQSSVVANVTVPTPPLVKINWPWRNDRVHINRTEGKCSLTKYPLRSLDVTKTQLNELAEKCKSLAGTNEADRAQFNSFSSWLQRQGQYDVIIDGANIGFHGQNHGDGGLSYTQVDAVARHFQRQGLKVLIVLSDKWLQARFYSNPDMRRPYKKKFNFYAARARGEPIDYSTAPRVTTEYSVKKMENVTTTIGDTKNDDHSKFERMDEEGNERILPETSTTRPNVNVKSSPLRSRSISPSPTGGSSSSNARSVSPTKDTKIRFMSSNSGSSNNNNNNGKDSNYKNHTVSRTDVSTAPVLSTNNSTTLSTTQRSTSTVWMPDDSMLSSGSDSSYYSDSSNTSFSSSDNEIHESRSFTMDQGKQVSINNTSSSSVSSSAQSNDASRLTAAPFTKNNSNNTVMKKPIGITEPFASSLTTVSNENIALTSSGNPDVEATDDNEDDEFGNLRVGPGVSVNECILAHVPEIDSSSAESIIAQWRAEKMVFGVTRGRNDDWFWMYAAVTQPDPYRVKLISNDLMRDHHFQMLTATTFQTWRERHQVRYSFRRSNRMVPNKNGYAYAQLLFRAPFSYSYRTQVSEDNKVWHFPLDVTAPSIHSNTNLYRFQQEQQQQQQAEEGNAVDTTTTTTTGAPLTEPTSVVIRKRSDIWITAWKEKSITTELR